ncbi:hypothetical protein [Streptomyces sp. NPDC001933]|uniref:hypothetical protein n=1 Tax=Streptomyces sp. NPDC001933 TaxID=3364626 RepID=UPI0036AF26D3
MEVLHGELLGVVAPLEGRCVAPAAVQLDRREERQSGFMAVVAAQRCPEVTRLFRRDGLEVTYSAWIRALW